MSGSQFFCLAPATKVHLYFQQEQPSCPLRSHSAHLSLISALQPSRLCFLCPFPQPTPTFAFVLILCFLCRFLSLWRLRSFLQEPQSSPKMVPLDASPYRASWGPLPPSPCTDTAQIQAVSDAAQCGHVAHPGFRALPDRSPWRPWFGGGTVQEHLLPHPWDQHLLLQYPGPHWEGQGQSWAVDRGCVVPPLPWGH